MTSLKLLEAERQQLEALLQTASYPLHRRIRLILLFDQGLTTKPAAQQAGYSPSRARYWKRQFLLRGMEIFHIQTRQEATQSAQENPATSDMPALSQPGILPDDPMSEAGRKTLLFHFLEMLKHEAGTIAGEDIEELHDMRVATRRMRAAFDVFGKYFSPKAINPFLGSLRTLGRTLGAVRDLDVSLEKLRLYLQNLSAEQQAGLMPLQEHWNQLLESARIEMLNHLNSQDYRNFKESFSTFLQTPGMGVARPKRGAPAQSTVRFLAPTLIYTRLANVMVFDSILDTASYEQLHALRIEFKIFRYTLEFFREVLGGEANAIINKIKTLQDHLGELNDANVACQSLTRFLKKWDRRQTELPLMQRLSPEPIVNYLAFYYAERHRLMTSFPAAWQHFTRPELRQSLASAVSVL